MSPIHTLNRAIRGGDHSRAAALIAPGAWLDARDVDVGDTALCAAVKAGAEALVAAIIAAGADLEAANRHGDRRCIAPAVWDWSRSRACCSTRARM